MESAEQARLELEARIREAQTVAGADDPPRVCFGQVKSVSNPVQTRNEVQIACGRTPRRQDGYTTDQDLVTCSLCKDILAGLSQVRAVPPTAAVPARATPAALSNYRQLVESLNVEQLEAHLAGLQGELAAVGVLLDAARARQKKTDEGAGG